MSMDDIVIAGHWEIGYMTPIIECRLWNMMLRDFEVSKWLMCPVSGIRNREQSKVHLSEYHTYDEMLETYSSYKRVFLEPRTSHQNPDTIWLHDFDHPDKCIYVLGSAHYNPTLAHRRDGDEVVTIKTMQDKGVLWSMQVIPIVLYDRMIKYGSYSSR